MAMKIYTYQTRTRPTGKGQWGDWSESRESTPHRSKLMLDKKVVGDCMGKIDVHVVAERAA